MGVSNIFNFQFSILNFFSYLCKNYQHMKIAVVGVTGLVGTVMLKVLEEFGYRDIELLPVASARSVGKTVTYFGKSYSVMSVDDAILQRPQIALFSAGGTMSLQDAPRFAEVGTFVIDNSSAWRMKSEVPLVVPEINASTITKDTKIIANPNCSTIQMVMALAPLHWKYGIKRVVVSTYQSVSGTGVAAVRQLEDETSGHEADKVYPHQIHRNLFPHGGNFNADGYTTEEQKLVDETRKILSAPEMQITATVVRVPVTGGHSEAVNIEFERDFELSDVRKLLSEFSGVIVLDEPEKNIYPMPLHCENKNETFVGRIRRDFSNPNSLNLWIVADNLRKGAATNAVQIAEYLIKQKITK
ncbi:MAG: aspartate-semialdehyde dehydrogenase [Bacteroidales bacterium]|jgi:aspartate-semialdehyde dehydrogenase|nr:aspartate-semialdehyde dehydrogenase [Bacteroidales bacterium]